MEIQIKKAKITSSLMSQATLCSTTDLSVGEILGWCIWKKSVFMVCYRPDFKTIHKMPIIKAVEEYKPSGETPSFFVRVTFKAGGFSPRNLECRDKEEMERVIKIYLEAKNEASKRGQFYI